jgi:hypothetical protein
MSEALRAAMATVQLTGADATPAAQFAMAHRIIDEAARGGCTRLSLAEAALNGAWH